MLRRRRSLAAPEAQKPSPTSRNKRSRTNKLKMVSQSFVCYETCFWSCSFQSPFPESKGHTLPLREVGNNKFSELKLAFHLADVEEGSFALSSPSASGNFAEPTESTASSALIMTSQATPNPTPRVGLVSEEEFTFGGNLKPTRVLALSRELSPGRLKKEGRPMTVNTSRKCEYSFIQRSRGLYNTVNSWKCQFLWG
jgi:hypothetical protein